MHPQLKLDRQLCFRLYTASRLMTQAYRPLLEPLGLTYPQYLVMMALWEQDHQLVGDLCRKLVLDTNTVTPLLKRMEAGGLIVRTHGVVDGRQTLVSLSRKGRQLEDQAKEVPACMVRSMDPAPMDAAQAADLAVALDRIIDVLKKNL